MTLLLSDDSDDSKDFDDSSDFASRGSVRCPVPVRVSAIVRSVPSAFATIKGLTGLKGPKSIAIKRYYDMIRGDFVMKPPL